MTNLKTDAVGSLIRQLKVIESDLLFLGKIRERPEKGDYPFLARTANAALFSSHGEFINSAIERVERAGFIVWKDETDVFFKTDGGIVSVPLTQRRHLKTVAEPDWRDALIG